MDLRQAQLHARALRMTRAELGDIMSADIELDASGVARLVPPPEAKPPIDADAIAHRQSVLQCVTDVVIAMQRAYFEGGELVALSKYDVADRTGLDPNDVDRAIRSKLVDCARGRIQLDTLFHTPPQSSASDQVKAMMREIIAAEDPRARLTDEQLREELAKREVVMQTKVVAMYRDAMGIPASRKR